ncbi:Rv3654c family TadE-like protein [Microbacterium sp. C7(2022)]|uniref:Rv3654c family TadE-like protein n=1 Tax=Microbacterium sp. C7(2022) TaxID=2992759 RepID=UPI00237B8676|nr:Rv3654c family TadE-like protein [Microbacterium sp. C7(2022)]MDE0546005.1 helicase [Microbacterium sp. C7(2022)]
MPGTVASAGAVAVASTLALGLVVVGAAHVQSQRVAAVADSAALAAADAASGAIVGVPCERAAQLAAAAGMELAGCEVESLVATVTVAAVFTGLPVTASARAGPPP